MNRGVYTLALRAASPWSGSGWLTGRVAPAGSGRFSPPNVSAVAQCRRPRSPRLSGCMPSAWGDARRAAPAASPAGSRPAGALDAHHGYRTGGRRAPVRRRHRARPVAPGLAAYDFPGATRRFLARWRPRCGLLIEREIWPNLLAAARAQRVPMGLVSARYSESSLRQARRMGAVMREALAGLDLVLAQTPQDAERLRQAGAPQAVVTGSEIRPGAAAGARGRRTPVARGAGPAGRGGRQYARRRRCGFHRGDQARVGPAGRALVPADSPASAALRRSGGPAG